jgi:CheY-like chemotaxis protein
MAGGIAHDFNNLLTPIVGETSLALGDLEPESALRPQLLRIQKAAHRAAALTNQMLAYSGQGALLIEPINLSLLVEEMGELLQSNISGGAALTYSLAKDLPTIEGDASQLSQIVMNLISNARESVEDGHGQIAIRTGVMAASEVKKEHIVGSGEVGSDLYVFLDVSDNGCGMEAETTLRIFDPFFSTKFTGRGLGLASVTGIVRGHRGLIVLESEVGRGTKFQVLLPAAKGYNAVQTGRPEHHSPWRSDGTVLVMDDEEGVRELAEATLQRAGFRVLLASDGREGLELFHRHAGEIRAVVLDRTMPDISGDKVFEEIRRTQPDAVVILMSGYSEDRAIAQIGEHLDAFLQKPFEPSALVDIVRRAVEAKSK